MYEDEKFLITPIRLRYVYSIYKNIWSQDIYMVPLGKDRIASFPGAISYYINLQLRKNNHYMIILDKKTKQVAGMFSYTRHNKHCLVSYCVCKDYRGRSIVDLCLSMIKGLEHCAIYAQVFPHNVYSKAVLERNNFEVRGSTKAIILYRWLPDDMEEKEIG